MVSQNILKERPTNRSFNHPAGLIHGAGLYEKEIKYKQQHKTVGNGEIIGSCSLLSSRPCLILE
jgi:hypothetical protein